MSSFVGLEQAAARRPDKNKIEGLNDLFGISDEGNGSVEIAIADLSPRKDHRFLPSPESKRELIKESIKQFGVLQPVLVRPASECTYKIDGKYEILSGHQRTSLSSEVGKKTVPCIILEGLTEDETEQIVAETNFQRDWGEMRHSERAAVISSYYNAQKRSNVRKEVLEGINSYLETYANPDEIRAEDSLSPGGTNNIREVADEYELSKNTIARYIRIDMLTDNLKLLLDDGELQVKAAVQLSYLSPDNQKIVDELLHADSIKCNEEKAKQLRVYQDKGKLTIATAHDILTGAINRKKPGKPKPYKIAGATIKKYFPDEQDEKKIGEVIEEALKMYFENAK